MSLKAILALLGSGEVGSVVNVLQSVVHAVIEEIEHLRGEHDVQTSACLEAMNKAEDRTRDLVGAAVMDLAKRMDALEGIARTRVGWVEGSVGAREKGVAMQGELAGYDGSSKE